MLHVSVAVQLTRHGAVGTVGFMRTAAGSMPGSGGSGLAVAGGGICWAVGAGMSAAAVEAVLAPGAAWWERGWYAPWVVAGGFLLVWVPLRAAQRSRAANAPVRQARAAPCRTTGRERAAGRARFTGPYPSGSRAVGRSRVRRARLRTVRAVAPWGAGRCTGRRPGRRGGGRAAPCRGRPVGGDDRPHHAVTARPVSRPVPAAPAVRRCAGG